jgi:GPH family glycoside/pentoside/hexuronide:cation symporter
MTSLSRRSLFAYGLFGLPLALVALPIYVYVPQFYAEHFGLSLSAIGVALLLARILDAFIDPGIGWWIDHSKASGGYQRPVLVSLPLLALGFYGLFQPPEFARVMPLAWFMLALMLTYTGFSLASIAHQSWGAALTQAISQRSRLTAAREACGLAGVILAAAMQQTLAPGWLPPVFILTLFLAAFILLRLADRPALTTQRPLPTEGLMSLLMPFHGRRFRWLFGAFVINGVAAAIPATLFLFFAKDYLQLAHYSGLFLLLYFIAAAASMPLWVMLAKRFGEARAWLFGMLMAALAFIWVVSLPQGDMIGFGMICIVSGLALGADLALPPALLAAVIADAGHSGQREGAYFGAWNWATKINLALAAGIALPLLHRLGYTPGANDAGALQALLIAYAVVPCALKLIAAVIVWRAPLRDL